MEITKIEPFKQSVLVEKIASLYQEVFGSKPWNEGYKCPWCEFTAPLDYKPSICPICFEAKKEILLLAYWPRAKIISDFYHEMEKPSALCLIATKKTELIGFAWGYALKIDPEANVYLEAPMLDRKISGELFYLDEVGIKPKHQGQGLGKKILKELFARQKQTRILLRTLNNSQMFNLIKHLGGETILEISRDRVLMTLAL